MLSCVIQVLYKENLGKGTPIPITPEMERVKHNQENFSSVFKQTNKNPFTFKTFKKIHGYILKSNQLIPIKNIDISYLQLNAAISYESVSPFWLNINVII